MSMDLSGQVSYRQLAEEIGEVLQAAAETAEKMQEEARADADRIRAEAEAELRNAYAEGRRILDEARMEADMLRAEAQWQSQEVLAQARRQAAERMTGANTRLANLEQAESRVLDRLAGVGQFLADTLATIREGQREAAAAIAAGDLPEIPEVPEHVQDVDDAAEVAEQPIGKVYFVEFPPPAQATPTPEPDPEPDEPYSDDVETEIVLSENSGPSLFNSDRERSEWAPPPEMPTWWIRGGAQG
ncbi:MAG TPA: ATP synthase F0 subunit B [Acidimicrobiia bacterium]|nr:ATP synthase F0 subunit B [Acidimicrobiia bacterium]